jgi:putative ABC transport system permease protein
VLTGGRDDTVKQDLRQAVRVLVKNPGFALVAMLTLALGIGANTAIFSVVDAVLLRPLPYPDPGRLVVVWEANPEKQAPRMYAAPPNLRDWRERSRSFDRLGAFTARSYTASGDGEAEQIHGVRVTEDTLAALGVAPMLGRGFSAEDDRPGAAPVAIVSHGLWQRRFGGDPSIVGRTVALDGRSYTLVGVMPQRFRFPQPPVLEGTTPRRQLDIWTPLGPEAVNQRGAHYVTVVGRLRGGVSIDAAQQELSGIASQLAREYPASNEGWDVIVVPLAEQVHGDARPALLVIWSAVSLVLLLACANVASLLLARAVGRRREMAIRMALGAGRLRVARQLLTESLLLSLTGGIAGVLVAGWLLRGLATALSATLPGLNEAGIDLRALAFTLLASLVAAVVFGSVPALELGRSRTQDWLRDRSGGPSSIRPQAFLVVGEVALAAVLLVAAALLIESFTRLRAVDPGFDSQEALTMRMALPAARYPQREHRVAFIDRLTETLMAVPSIRAVGFVDAIALADDRQGTGVESDGRDVPAMENAVVNAAFVTPGYFDALGIRLYAGRAFGTGDRAGTTPVLVVNRAFADRFFPGQSAVGQRVRLGFQTQVSREIIGIVADERHAALDREPPPGVYVPYLQYGWSSQLTMIVRTASAPSAALETARGSMRALDPQIALYDARTMGQIVDEAVSRPRLSATLVALFGLIALALAFVGVYGLMSQLVGQRTPEFGVRVALGATPRDILRMVLAQSGGLALVGIAVGLPAALAFARLLRGLLFGIAPTAPAVYLAVGATIAAAALAASYVPARRATRVDPLIALRAE